MTGSFLPLWKHSLRSIHRSSESGGTSEAACQSSFPFSKQQVPELGPESVSPDFLPDALSTAPQLSECNSRHQKSPFLTTYICTHQLHTYCIAMCDTSYFHILYLSTIFTVALGPGLYYYLHFTDEETESSRGFLT